ncbi:YCF48-related protein [Alcaligenes sp. A-TC2]|uniref:WD40/YVTN/BNR-like repeat-containing protein n=1 Tax=Alcaligenes nematophilus TaxID=2994643 RepID=UPI00224C860C|nr:YCF48-related protein [Alcaligenes nematophilus]MCX5471519.1 YCF48-related protein [Alcaligenes nematophilus]
MKKRTYWPVVVALGLASLSIASGHAESAFPALDRPALAVKAVQRSVLLAAALDDGRIVAVGERGVIALSDDGGVNWRQARNVPVSVTLTAVQFTNTHHGWAVGHGGVILQTTDGGESWELVTDGRGLAQVAVQAAELRLRRDPQDEAAARQLRVARSLASDAGNTPLFDLCFVDAQHGYVVGAYGLFFETRDGGLTWNDAMDRLHNPGGLHLYAIQARGKEVFIGGEQGLMQVSRDKGRRFQALQSPYEGSWFGLALNDSGLMAVGLRGNAFHSQDGGSTWTRVAGAPEASLPAAVSAPDGSVLITSQAGQLYASADGRVMAPLLTQPMPPLSGTLVLPDGSVIAYGVGGVLRLPVSLKEMRTRP